MLKSLEGDEDHLDISQTVQKLIDEGQQLCCLSPSGLHQSVSVGDLVHKSSITCVPFQFLWRYFRRRVVFRFGLCCSWNVEPFRLSSNGLILWIRLFLLKGGVLRELHILRHVHFVVNVVFSFLSIFFGCRQRRRSRRVRHLRNQHSKLKTRWVGDPSDSECFLLMCSPALYNWRLKVLLSGNALSHLRAITVHQYEDNWCNPGWI